METLNVLLERRSIRKYRAVPVPDEILEEIVRAGLYAPSGLNLQPWYFAVARTAEEARSFLETAPQIVFVVEDYIAPERGFITRVELVDGAVALIVKRSVVKGGLSAYHLGSRYELYSECAEEIRATAVLAGRALGIGFGSFDIIENGGRAYVIDANSVSNVSPDNTETFGGFDLMREYAQAIAKRERRG